LVKPSEGFIFTSPNFHIPTSPNFQIIRHCSETADAGHKHEDATNIIAEALHLAAGADDGYADAEDEPLLVTSKDKQ